MKDIRFKLRKHDTDLKREEKHDENLSISIDHTLQTIKQYIKAANDQDFRMEQLDQKHGSRTVFKERSMLFGIEDVQRSIVELQDTFNVNFKEISNEQLIKQNDNSTNISDKIDKIAQKYEQWLQFLTSNNDIQLGINKIGEQFVELTKAKSLYQEQLKYEIEERDVYKQRSFDESKLNIHLEKFCGYNSVTDIYTFQSMFNKIYLRTTPRRLRPDLLKNNFLKEPALTLVKSLTEIDEI